MSRLIPNDSSDHTSSDDIKIRFIIQFTFVGESVGLGELLDSPVKPRENSRVSVGRRGPSGGLRPTQAPTDHHDLKPHCSSPEL